MPPNRLFARFTMELSMDTEPIGASSAEMDQPTGAVAEIPASPMEMQIMATVILFVRMEPKRKSQSSFRL